MSHKKKLLIVQPYLTKYRLPVFNDLCDEYEVLIAASKNSSFGNITNDEINNLKFFELKEFKLFKNKIFWQKDLLKLILTTRPEYIFFSANPRYLSLWVCSLLSKLLGMKVIFHGQGLYNKLRPSLVNKITYYIYKYLCNVYICYTESCLNSLEHMAIHTKCVVAENSIINISPNPIAAPLNKGILFIGRLRDGVDLDLLLNSVIDLNKNSNEVISLYVIGGGTLLDKYTKIYQEYSFIHFMGEIYDSVEITKLAKNCFAGCYPGNAGLSILHYMSLSLVPITHSVLHEHMGPEPSYIKDGQNGVLFEKDSINSLTTSITKIKSNTKLLEKMQNNAFDTYKKLTNPSLGQRIIAVLKKV